MLINRNFMLLSIVVLVHNRCDHKMFDAKQLNHVCQTVDKFFGQSRLKLRGEARYSILPLRIRSILNDVKDHFSAVCS